MSISILKRPSISISSSVFAGVLEQQDEQITAWESEVEATAVLSEAVSRRGERSKNTGFQLQVCELQSKAALLTD